MAKEKETGFFKIEKGCGSNCGICYEMYPQYFERADLTSSYQTSLISVSRPEIEKILGICVDDIIKWQPAVPE